MTTSDLHSSATSLPLPLILASSSKHRRKLLKTITNNFQSFSPNIDESPMKGESVKSLVTRLSVAKAQAVAKIKGNALIIGSDQAAIFDGKIIGKPKNHAAAVEHLMIVSGKSITLQTGVALLNSQSNTVQSTVVPATVTFRTLNEKLVNAYLKTDKPYDCAGSVKVESLGIMLIESIRSDDPNALIGLPLIKLITMLNNENYPLLNSTINSTHD